MGIWNTITLIAGALASPVLMISYIPQIVGFYKNKSAKDVSLSFWFILDLSLLLLTIMAIDGYIQTGSIGLVFAQGINLLLALIVTFQVIYYKKSAA